MPRQITTPFTYQYPAGTAAVSGQPISSTAYNAYIVDIANTLNSAWPVNFGGTGTTDGSVSAPNGTAVGPSMSFASDITTGLYRIAAGEIGLTLSGALAWDFAASTTTYTWADAGASVGPTLILDRNSASAAANDLVGAVTYTAKNSTPATKTYASITTRLDTVTAASEAATMQIAVQKAGTLTTYLEPGSNAAGAATANAVGLPLGQLSFPATQNASSDVNTLDDYEEGTWTPSVGGSASYTTQLGTYTKIGRMVFAEFALTINAIGTGSTTTISGLPFANAIARSIAGYISAWATIANSRVFVGCYVNASASTIGFTGVAAAGTSMASTSDNPITSSTSLVGTVIYEAAT